MKAAAPKKPEFLAVPPPLEIPSLKELKREYYRDSSILIEETETTVTYLEWELDYGGCYYEGDSPSIQVDRVTYSKEMMPNPRYKTDLKFYNSAKRNYEKRLARYEQSQISI